MQTSSIGTGWTCLDGEIRPMAAAVDVIRTHIGVNVRPDDRRRLGKTTVRLTRLGFGGAPLGNLFAAVLDENAQATLDAAWAEGVRYFDTAPLYGLGLSERRVGDYLRSRPADEYVLSTKIGRRLRPSASRMPNQEWPTGLPFDSTFDYTYDGIMRSYEDSLQRLGLAFVDLLVVHDLDIRHHQRPEIVEAHRRELASSGARALDELRTSGAVRGVGVGINELGLIPRFIELLDFDFVLTAMKYTLLDQSLSAELELCSERRVGIVVGAVFNSGILATGAEQGGRFDYTVAPPHVVGRVRHIESLCAEHNVPLPAAALQFPFRNKHVTSVIPGARSPEEVVANARYLALNIPEQLWLDLFAAGLIEG